ncbi:hypothetical protein DLAC_03852 [Tieghemostelium lacteum]|uniref:Solute carrier family 66 member 2 n=1 Tax=Tieghemostelium lacteum TaxID=361077 RepID=A0A152A0Z4_TIELA|nr:hypothetical protein DLAC_03852 [Tieghemostelium lacteum]|eukprot:KYQ99889.1 hypothetical protein DLAC_03852 [Tieghemostelium lacteum]
MFATLTSLVFIFAPVAAYIPQYRDIQRTSNCDGFSSKVCLILLLSNILRCFFWLGKQFDNTLLYQSIIMIIAQIIMLHLCVSIKSKDSLMNRSKKINRQQISSSFFEQPFWEWDSFFPYVLFLAIYTFTFFVISYVFLFTPSYFELLGGLSLAIEATLGLPQLLQNYNKKSTKGLSAVLIISWFVGDLFKTLYFYYTSAPLQFIMCGLFQILVDTAITYQMLTY